MSDKNKKMSKLVPIVIGVVLIAAAGTSIGAYVYSHNDNKESNSATVSVEQKKLKETQVVNNQQSVATTVEIQFDDTAIAVGTVLKMVALVTPEDTEKALVWSSSDANVLEVNNEGVVTVKAAGTAVVTATVGTVSDAVIIEGINNVAEGSEKGLPVYTTDSNGTFSYNKSSSSGAVTSSGNNGGQSSLTGAGNTSGVGAVTDNGTGNTGNVQAGSDGWSDNDSIVSDNNNQWSDNGGSDNGNSNAYGNNNYYGDSNNGGGDNYSDNSNSETGYTGSGNSSSGVAGELPDMGFSQIMSNVYVCEENNVYYGEIIVQPNVTIVYIKQRSAAFDAKIQNVIAELLPESSSQVWSNYLSATTDRTFTVDGRRVRIVVAANGGHSQIVIYN